MPHQEYVGSDGKVWPSVTELTKLLPQDWIFAWYKHSVEKKGYDGWLENKAKSEEGMKLGTIVHAEIEDLIKTNGAAQACNEAYALYDAVAKTVDEWVEIEPHLICNTLRYAGTADMIVRLQFSPGLWIGDWKTSFTKSDTHPIQLAAYAMAWNEGRPDQIIDQGFIARVDKKDEECRVKIDEYLGLKRYFPVVRALREIFDYTNSLGQFEKPPKKNKKNALLE